MRIAIDARFYGTENTGLGRYSQNVLQNLLDDPKDSHEYFIFVTPKYINLKFKARHQLIPLSVRHYTLKEQFVLPYLLLRYRINLLYTLHFNAPILTPVKTIVTIHDLIKTHFASYETTTHNRLAFLIKRLGYLLVMSSVVRKANKIIVPSQAVKENILTAYKNLKASKIFSVHEAVDLAFQNSPPSSRSSSKSGSIKLLFVGNAYPHKNLVGLLQAFAILSKEGNYRLTLLSKSTPYLKRTLSLLPKVLHSKVKLIESVSDQILKAQYLKSDILVTPSFMEGFGLPALEALHLGVRVVASDIPVYREVYGKYVTYCNPFDSHSIASGIKESLRAKTLCYRSNRTWQHVGSEIKQILFS